jgi:hypothetical protein
MKTFTQKIESWFSAVAFAEAGEHQTAIQVAAQTPVALERKRPVVEFFNRVFAAAALAEEGLHKDAERVYVGLPTVTVERKPSFLEVVGLNKAPVQLVLARSKPSFLEMVGLSAAPVHCMTIRS